MPSRQNGAYISQILHTEPTSAGVVLDSVYRGLEPIGVSRRFVRLTDRLWLSGDGLRRDPGLQVVRAVRGILWYGWIPVRVLVELVEWSSTACEVAIRPLGYSWPVWTDRYAHSRGRSSRPPGELPRRHSADPVPHGSARPPPLPSTSSTAGTPRAASSEALILGTGSGARLRPRPSVRWPDPTRPPRPGPSACSVPWYRRSSS